ncbi:hypothetical protein IMCC12053_182 [Celeribacter marinus]|uniref:Uncharacterized protein n=1 Tax=Celeribacter marinus TaxID=1397108 RepID=A0A0P0A734_9RHOB|nr:hypothetical protein IMCC12053_182 [Celeribacter marinus]
MPVKGNSLRNISRHRKIAICRSDEDHHGVTIKAVELLGGR